MTGLVGPEPISAATQAALDAKVDEVASTDNAIARFDGTTGALQNSAATIEDGGRLVTAGGATFNNSAVNITNAAAGDFSALLIDAAGSGTSVQPVFKVQIPNTGAQKAFQLAIQGGVGWGSFEYGIGGAAKPGFALGDGFGSRDVNLYRDAANVLKTDDALVATKITARHIPLTGTIASTATPSINSDAVDYYSITALAVNITSVTVTGTPIDGQRLRLAITGTASRTITWGAAFEASTVALPTTTSGTSRLDIEFVYNGATAKWRCLRAV